MHAGSLMEFNPKSVLAIDVGHDLGLQHGSLILIVAWVGESDVACCTKMQRPVTQEQIDAVMDSLRTDLNIGIDTLEDHFIPANTQITDGGITRITKQELLEMFPGYEYQIEKLIAKHPAIVVFENQQFDSSEFGMKTAMAIGPDATYKDLNDVVGKWLHDLPSQRQYPTYIYTSTVKAE